MLEDQESHILFILLLVAFNTFFQTWCYSLLSDNVQDLLSAATHVQMLSVIGACSDFLRRELSYENCVDIATIADTYALNDLKNDVYKFICKNLQTVSFSLEFQRLSSEQLHNLLQCRFPVNVPECEVLSSVMMWLGYNMDDRLKEARALLAAVNFEDIYPNEFQDLLNLDVMKEVLAWNPELRENIYARLGRAEGLDSDVSPFLVNKRGYEEALVIVGGFSSRRGMTNDILYYHLSSARWETLTSIPHIEQCNFGLAVLENNLYVVGGCFNQQMQEDTHSYGFRFMPKDCSWESIATMAQERCRFYLGVVEGHLYAIGGDPSASSNLLDDDASCECYDPQANEWSEIASLPGNRMQHAGAAYGHLLFISGGLQEIDGDAVDRVQCYNTITNSWSEKSPMLHPRADHTMFVHKGRMYVIGGWYIDPITQSRVMAQTLDHYVLEEDRWEIVMQVNEPRLYATYTMFNNCLHVVGGWKHGDYQHKALTMQIYNMEDAVCVEETGFSKELWEHMACSMYIPTCLASS